MATSPWGKIDQVQPTNLSEIMSEEYARGLQDKEIKKVSQKLCDHLTTAISPTSDSNIPILNQSDEENLLEEPSTKEILPEDVLKVIREDSSIAGVVEVCDSDALIAQVLQSQFDHEYNEQLTRIEKQKNKQSKLSISLDKYRRIGDVESDSDDDLEDWGYKTKDWDRFETNEKKFDTIPKCGFKIDKDAGEMITKHDPDMCGVRNACRVMSFPPEFPTGDAAGFDMKLSNQVYNQLKTYSRKTKKPKMQDRKENIATAEMGVDAPTRLLLYKLINNQILEQVNGIISTGKEALILHANSDPSYAGELLLPKECAIKIFKTTLNEFKQRDRYIKDDWRFKDRFSKQNNRVVINMWAEKEMHNMMRMQKCGINCPDVVILKKHILVMSFIGDNHNAAPKLKDARLTDAQLSLAYEEILEMIQKLYNDAKLVHADLSEYNILWYNEKCWFIDVAQSVEPEHPSALEFLMRDCNNIINFFTRRGLPNILTKEQLFEKITLLNAESHNAAMLERIHQRGATIKQSTNPVEDDCPEDLKPISYPFDLAWEKSLIDKSENYTPIFAETTEAMKNISLQNPIDCKGTVTVAVAEN